MEATYPESLLRYEHPVFDFDRMPSKGLKNLPEANDANPEPELREKLESLLPPNRFERDGQFFVQHISTEQLPRSDVVALDEEIDNQIKSRKARMTGICPIRNRIYEDCFNELIRQIAIDCYPRGALLLDVKKELDLTIASYENQYSSSMAHAIRKAAQGKQRNNEIKETNAQLEADIKKFQEKIEELKQKIGSMEQTDAAEAEAKNKEHSERVAQLKSENFELRQKLEAVLTLPSTK